MYRHFIYTYSYVNWSNNCYKIKVNKLNDKFFLLETGTTGKTKIGKLITQAIGSNFNIGCLIDRGTFSVKNTNTRISTLIDQMTVINER